VETATYQRLYIGTMTAFLCDEEREGQERGNGRK